MEDQFNNPLKRYTSLSVALDMITNQRLTLLSPGTWDDKNDIASLESFRAERKMEKVFACCFTQAPETFHHWRVFGSSIEGVRVNINRRLFLDSLKGNPAYLYDSVEYLTLDQMDKMKEIDVCRIPFLKRWAFRDEKEFRVIYECQKSNVPFHHVELKREWITSITLSPWLPDNLIDSIKAVIKSLPHCDKVRIQRTSLRDHAGWQAAISKVAKVDAASRAAP